MGDIGRTDRRREIARGFLAMLVPAVLVAFAWHRTGIYFETNDDRYIASILSGMITGEPDAHAIHINYLLGVPLSLLYRATARVPWYGGMLVLFQWLVYGAVLDCAYARCRRWHQALFVTAMTAGFFLAYYYCIGLLEFTSTAAFLAMGGYACLLLRREGRAGFVWFFLLELLGYLLRSDAMLMIQPLGFTAAAISMAEDRETSWKAKGKAFMAIGAAVFLILCLGVAGDAIGYPGREWEQYKEFDKARAQMFDYYGSPDYQEVAPVLDEYGISREKYEAYCAYMIMDWEPGGGAEGRLAAYAAEKGKRPFEISGILQEIYEASLLQVPWKIFYVTVAAWGIFILWTILNGRLWMLLRCIALFGGARMAVWAYLAWKGRHPLRVTLPLLACEVLLLLVLVWRHRGGGDGRGWKKAVTYLGCAGFGMLCVFFGWRQVQFVGRIVAGQEVFTEGFKEVLQRCQSQPENRYLLDSNSLSAYSGSAFETSVYHPVNAVFSGGWFSGSPGVQRRLEEYLGEAEGFYFLIYMDGNQEDTPQFRYLVQTMGREPELAEQWPAAQGGAYGIYYFEGAFPFS